MALSDRINEKRPAPIHGYPCSVGKLLAELDGDEREALLHMLGTNERPGWSAADIFAALTSEGHTVGYQTINRHRGGKCRCDKAAA